jgi:hypothetical protein
MYDGVLDKGGWTWVIGELKWGSDRTSEKYSDPLSIASGRVPRLSGCGGCGGSGALRLRGVDGVDSSRSRTVRAQRRTRRRGRSSCARNRRVVRCITLLLEPFPLSLSIYHVISMTIGTHLFRGSVVGDKAVNRWTMILTYTSWGTCDESTSSLIPKSIFTRPGCVTLRCVRTRDPILGPYGELRHGLEYMYCSPVSDVMYNAICDSPPGMQAEVMCEWVVRARFVRKRGIPPRLPFLIPIPPLHRQLHNLKGGTFHKTP